MAGTDAHTKKTKGHAADYLVTPSFACALDNDGGFATSENAHAMVHTVSRSCKRQMSTARKRGCNGTHSHSTQHNNTQRTAQQHTAQQHTAHTSSLPSQSARTDPAATASAARATTTPAATSTRPSSGLPRRSTSHPNRARAGQVKGNTRGERTRVGWLCACVRVCVCACVCVCVERRRGGISCQVSKRTCCFTSIKCCAVGAKKHVANVHGVCALLLSFACL